MVLCYNCVVTMINSYTGANREYFEAMLGDPEEIVCDCTLPQVRNGRCSCQCSCGPMYITYYNASGPYKQEKL